MPVFTINQQVQLLRDGNQPREIEVGGTLEKFALFQSDIDVKKGDKIVNEELLDEPRVITSIKTHRLIDGSISHREVTLVPLSEFNESNTVLHKVKDSSFKSSSNDLLPETFDVAFSFAGEDRHYVEQVRAALGRSGLTVFYDQDYQVPLWGCNLTETLHDIYSNRASAVVMFISEAYEKKEWTVFEKRSALERALNEKGPYILPARLDQTTLPGLHGTISYIDISKLAAENFAVLVEQKIKLGKQDSQTKEATSDVRKRSALAQLQARNAARDYSSSGDGILRAVMEGQTFVIDIQKRLENLGYEHPILGITTTQLRNYVHASQKRLDGASVEVSWSQPYAHRIEDAKLELSYWDGFKPVPGGTYFKFPDDRPPRLIKKITYKLVSSKPHEWKWTKSGDDSTSFSSGELLDHTETEFIELINKCEEQQT